MSTPERLFYLLNCIFCNYINLCKRMTHMPHVNVITCVCSCANHKVCLLLCNKLRNTCVT